MSEKSTIDILRGPKIADFVIFDWVATIASAMLVSHFVKYDTFMILIILLIISIILHYILDVDTKTNWLLGISKYPKRETAN